MIEERTQPELDWSSAAAVGVRLTRPGPRVSDEYARGAVTDLRRFARDAQDMVRQTARIDAPTDTAPVIVADRLARTPARLPMAAEARSQRSPTRT